MTEAAKCFQDDVQERKRIARGAAMKLNGSKSKKCNLPYEQLTRSQIRKLNGEVRTYKMKEPMSWTAFKDLDNDLQQTYLQGLIDVYNAQMVDVCRMFDITTRHLSAYIHERLPQVKFPGAGHRMTKQQKDRWNEFLHEVKKDPEPVDKKPEESKTTVKKKAEPVRFDRFNIDYSGNLVIDDIANQLKQLLGSNCQGYISISFHGEEVI